MVQCGLFLILRCGVELSVRLPYAFFWVSFIDTREYFWGFACSFKCGYAELSTKMVVSVENRRPRNGGKQQWHWTAWLSTTDVGDD